MINLFFSYNHFFHFINFHLNNLIWRIYVRIHRLKVNTILKITQGPTQLCTINFCVFLLYAADFPVVYKPTRALHIYARRVWFQILDHFTDKHKKDCIFFSLIDVHWIDWFFYNHSFKDLTFYRLNILYLDIF